MITCSLCGEPMPAGEEMFKYHGYSGPCPKPALRPSREPAGGDAVIEIELECREAWKLATYWRRIATGCPCESEVAQQLEAIANDLTDMISEEQERTLLGAAALKRRANPSAPQDAAAPSWSNWIATDEGGEAHYFKDEPIHWPNRRRLATPPPSAAPAVVGIDAMVDRFLCWRLPDDFAPDAGISFKPITNPAWTHDYWPTGTNLLHAGQARAMFEHCLAATPAAPGGMDAPHALNTTGVVHHEAESVSHSTPASTPQEDDEYTEQDALQSLMLWLSVGGAHGYVNPRTAEERIRWGVDHIIVGEVNRARRMFHLTNPPEPTPQPAAGVDVVPVSVALSAVEHVGAANYDSRVAEARRWIREAALAPPAPGAE